MPSNAITWFCILLLTVQVSQSAIFFKTRASLPETENKIKLIYDNVEENANQAIKVLEMYGEYGRSSLQLQLPIVLNKVSNSTSTAVKIVEQLQTELEKAGNHHVVDMCITYDKLYKTKNGITTKIKNQVVTSATQISRGNSEAVKEINAIKTNSSILFILTDQCKIVQVPDKCYDDVLVEANKVGDELISGIVKQHKEATTSVDSILSFFVYSTRLYVQQADNDLKIEVDRIIGCIEEEVEVNPFDRRYLYPYLFHKDNEIA